jgi:hypothetical protein
VVPPEAQLPAKDHATATWKISISMEVSTDVTEDADECLDVEMIGSARIFFNGFWVIRENVPEMDGGFSRFGRMPHPKGRV